MNLYHALFLGIIQGITEFLPISSSAHLMLVSLFFKDFGEHSTSFDIALHFGSILAILLFLNKRILRLIKEIRKTATRKLIICIIITTIPALLVGYFFQDRLNSLKDNYLLACFMLILIGVLMVLNKWIFKEGKISIEEVKFEDAFKIGIAQAFAFIRGTSRSGVTILAGLHSKFKYQDILEYSFLASIPLMLSISFYELFNLINEGNMQESPQALLVGILSSFITSLFAIRLLSKIISSKSLIYFGLYRIFLGLVVLAKLFVLK